MLERDRKVTGPACFVLEWAVTLPAVVRQQNFCFTVYFWERP